MKKILFTGYHFNFLSGSQMYICEMAEYLQTTGYDITIASPNTSEDMKVALKSKHITLVDSEKICLNHFYDIVFSFHNTIINTLITRGLQYGKIVNFSLSPFLDIESPPHFHKYLSLLGANSEETKTKLIEVDGVDAEKIIVLPNFLPDNFISYKIEKKVHLRKICIVSNHIPNELKELPTILKNVQIDFIGNEYKQQAVTPELLSQYDAVISIGKTVQYCLGLEIPIYEYDHFGGCGYITPDNFAHEAYLNFSGRATKRQLPATTIAQELTEYYQAALNNTSALREKAIESFSYKNIASLMQKIHDTPQIPSTTKEIIFEKCCQKEALINKKKRLRKSLNKINNIITNIGIYKKVKCDNQRQIYVCGIKILSYQKNKKKSK